MALAATGEGRQDRETGAQGREFWTNHVRFSWEQLSPSMFKPEWAGLRSGQTNAIYHRYSDKLLSEEQVAVVTSRTGEGTAPQTLPNPEY